MSVTSFHKIWGLRVFPNKLKLIKKKQLHEGLLHRFFVSGYTLTVLAYIRIICKTSVKRDMSLCLNYTKYRN